MQKPAGFRPSVKMKEPCSVKDLPWVTLPPAVHKAREVKDLIVFGPFFYACNFKEARF